MSEPIGKSRYTKLPEAYWIQQKVYALRTIKNRVGSLPRGTRFSVERKFGGFTLQSDPCPCCGYSLYVTRVSYEDLSTEPVPVPHIKTAAQ